MVFRCSFMPHFSMMLDGEGFGQPNAITETAVEPTTVIMQIPLIEFEGAAQ
jgi:hypothetical protein